MYAGFNGEFRRKPVVSIRGVGTSKKETKEDLVKRLKEERAEREVSYFLYSDRSGKPTWEFWISLL